MSLESAIRQLLVDSRPDTIGELLEYLGRRGVRTKKDLRYLDRSYLEESGMLNDVEIHKIINREIPIQEAVEEILTPGGESRIEDVTKILENEGASLAEHLKYFDWNSLSELKELSAMEVEKIMRYQKTYFPEEYKENDSKRKEELKLKRETELLEHNVHSEADLYKAQLGPSEVTSNRNNILKVINNLHIEYMDLKTQESHLVQDGVILSKKYLPQFIIFLLFTPLFIVLITLRTAMPLAALVILGIVASLMSLYLLYALYHWIGRMVDRQDKLKTLRTSIMETEYRMEQRRIELDNLDESN